ncbi:MAG: D-alanine--D-alanine ligase [Gammaproteobacteria bacterium]|nr:D-alanine--D-alanine ligase [Gammaproteobacteria bacterium]
MNSRTTNARDFGKVAVVYGGTSAEREVSLESGKAVFEALRRKGVDAHALDVFGTELLRTLQQGGFDRVFIVLHGRGGEDGVLQGALEMLDLPYTGSGVLGSALGMDKVRTKQVWQALGLPTPEFAVLNRPDDVSRSLQEIGLPLIVKPAREGSTLGITQVTTPDALRPAWQAALTYDTDVVAERYIQGAEYTASLLGSEALPLIRIEAASGFYDYQAKYVAHDTRYLCPCGLDQQHERELQQMAVCAFEALGCSGWGRVDFMVDAEGQPWLLEANTVPGMTSHSLVPMAARAAGMDFDTLVWRILETSLTASRTEAGRVA